jgi:hypothetical protein
MRAFGLHAYGDAAARQRVVLDLLAAGFIFYSVKQSMFDVARVNHAVDALQRCQNFRQHCVIADAAELVFAESCAPGE